MMGFARGLGSLVENAATGGRGGSGALSGGSPFGGPQRANYNPKLAAGGGARVRQTEGGQWQARAPQGGSFGGEGVINPIAAPRGGPSPEDGNPWQGGQVGVPEAASIAPPPQAPPQVDLSSRYGQGGPFAEQLAAILGNQFGMGQEPIPPGSGFLDRVPREKMRWI